MNTDLKGSTPKNNNITQNASNHLNLTQNE